MLYTICIDFELIYYTFNIICHFAVYIITKDLPAIHIILYILLYYIRTISHTATRTSFSFNTRLESQLLYLHKHNIMYYFSKYIIMYKIHLCASVVSLT